MLHARAHGTRRALRERLGAFLRAAGNGRLLRLVREAAFAAAVAGALVGTACPARAIDLADVAAGKGGFAIKGKGWLPGGTGASVANAGDVNGDGIPDAIVGSLYCYQSCGSVEGYVVFGRADGAPSELEDVADGQGGFVIRGDTGDSGLSVSGAGDVDGDGLSDLFIGAPGAGASYVVLGKGTTESVELSAIAAGEGGHVIGAFARIYSPLQVSGVGDVNGDGLADLLIGAPRADPGDRGAAGVCYLVFGKDTGQLSDLSEIAAGRGGFAIRGERAGDRTGWSVSGTGDVNGDGLPDILIGARYGSGAYVVFGKATTETVELSDVAAGRGGFVIRGAGESVRGAGDVNGDGLPDILIGTGGANASYVIFGKKTTEVVELSDVAAGRGGFVVREDNQTSCFSSGGSVSGAGDVNGDGLSDLLVGAPKADPEGRRYAGASYIVFGKLTTEAVKLSEVAAGRGGFVIRGESAGDESGLSVSGTGDVNGDGIPDLAIGNGSGGLSGDGKAYVVFGPRREGVPSFHRGDPNSSDTTDISDAIAIFGFLFLGDPPTLSCKEAADANNDGAVDISDGIYLLSWLFTGGPEPAAPGPAGVPCGVDPDPSGSPGDLGCEAYEACH